jgi:hypothetical protein
MSDLLTPEELGEAIADLALINAEISADEDLSFLAKYQRSEPFGFNVLQTMCTEAYKLGYFRAKQEEGR